MDQTLYSTDEALLQALSKMLQTRIVSADSETRQLHGGTLGDVWLLTGSARNEQGQALPFSIVRKTQKKWERYKDPDSWRREYDLYRSGLDRLFTDSFRWPVCYEARCGDDEIQLWMEYIDGVSGLALTGDQYERAALELGRFQGRLHAGRPSLLGEITNLSGVDYVENFYRHYRSWPQVYDYIRSPDCPIPRHLCDMLITVDDTADAILARMKTLPVVLCQRDYWVANILCCGDKLRIIDWDTAGWGYLGEDIASLIADEADVEHMAEYYFRCVSAYYNGFSEFSQAAPAGERCVYEQMLLMFGYRLVEWYQAAQSSGDKSLQIDTLQKLYEIGRELRL